MAKTGAVWGIDIGQCALKALRCRRHDDDPARIVAEAFDYIEYAKILSQPEAEADELIREALQQFLSRNDLAGDSVAISVSGQSGLARFIKLPPVESKKIPDIVKYEAKQQIPFALEDVVWDYQQMAGGSVEEGYALETEVGLFAMKRDQVYQALEPFTDQGIAVDFVQLTPLAIYNFVVFDLMHELPSPEEYDPEDPPPSTVVISLGTDTTDLVVTSGFRVWQRSIPIGGSHFTKALTRELRLTFTKAEHLKRNATKAENPKVVFRSMLPVFGDLVAEVQRSIGYFTSIDRNAKIGNVVVLGNALKLPGLQRYLADNLKQPVRAVKAFRGLDGAEVTESRQFKGNLLSFCVSYGLCLQGLAAAKISTNLLPREIVTERLVRAKKPWAVAAVAALLMGGLIHFYGHYSAWQSANTLRPEFASAITQANQVQSNASTYTSEHLRALASFEQINTIGSNLVGNVEGRLLWLELLKAIDAALPSVDPNNEPELVADRRELHIEALECERFDDLSSWYQAIAEKYQADYREIFSPQPTADAEGDQTPVEDADPYEYGQNSSEMSQEDQGPTGAGWVIELRGYHYHNSRNQQATFVRNTLIRNLHQGIVQLPNGNEDEVEEVPIKDLGIQYPVIAHTLPLGVPQPLVDPNVSTEDAWGTNRREAADDNEKRDSPKWETVKRFDFIVQFCWIETPRSKRWEIAQQRREDPDPTSEERDAE